MSRVHAANSPSHAHLGDSSASSRWPFSQTAEDASEELLREIEQTGQLSAQNILFLRIRRLAGLRQFDAILALPELATVLAIRRPARVSASLLEAVYVTEIAGFEADGDAEGALRHFEDVVLQKYPALFKSRHGLQTPEAIKSFMLHALAVRPDDAESRARLLASPDLSPADLQFLERLAGLPETPAAPEATLDDAVSAALAEDYDAALQIAARQPASAERAELLIRCAFEIDSMDAIRAAADAFSNLDSASARSTHSPHDYTQRYGATSARRSPVKRAHSPSTRLRRGLNGSSRPLRAMRHRTRFRSPNVQS